MNSEIYGDPLNTQHSIGIGTAEVDPEGRFIGAKNAVEVMQNGDQYVIGIGGYEGKDIENKKTIQEVINNKQDQLTPGDNITIEDNVISADVSGEGIKFDEDLVTMYTIGKYNGTLANPVTIPAAGRTFKQV